LTDEKKKERRGKKSPQRNAVADKTWREVLMYLITGSRVPLFQSLRGLTSGDNHRLNTKSNGLFTVD